MKKNKPDHLTDLRKSGFSGETIRKGPLPPPSMTLRKLLKMYADRLTGLPYSQERSALVDACLFIIESGKKR